MVPLKDWCNFCRTREMFLSNCEINIILTWSETRVLSNNTKVTAFSVSDTELYVPAVTLSTQYNAKLLQQLKSGFKRTFNWNKYQWKVTIQAPKKYLDYLIDPKFHLVNRIFVLSFEISTGRMVHRKNDLPAVEINHYIVMIDGQIFFWWAS